MALWLVLKDFNGAIVTGGSEWTPAGAILDDLLTNVAALQAAGCPMLPWTASPAQVNARNAFLSRSPTPGQPLASENLLDLLATFGAFGGGGGGGGGVSFTFRPIAVDDPSLNLYGSWASLVAATATLAAAGLPFVITIDLALSGADFLIPTATNFGGQAVLRGVSPVIPFKLQVAFPNTLEGVCGITNFMNLAAAGVAIGGALIQPMGVSIFRVELGSTIGSGNPNSPLIQMSAGQFLLIALFLGGTIDSGVFATVDVPAGASLQVALFESASVKDDSISGAAGASLDFQKQVLSASLPETLVNFAGYANGGIGTTATFQITHQVPLAQFGARGIPLVAGVTFLPYLGNHAIPLSLAIAQPYRESSNFSRPRLLATGTIWAAVDAAAPGAVDIEVLLNGVPVPGLGVFGLNVSTMTTPYALQATPPVVLADFDEVTVRVTVPGGGIVASPIDVFCALESV